MADNVVVGFEVVRANSQFETTIYGDGNGNTIVAGRSNASMDQDQTLYGRGGDDTLSSGGGDDFLDGGVGQDMVSYATANSAISVDLSLSGAQDTGDGLDTLVDIERVTGSSFFGDTLTGNAAVNWLLGEGGADLLSGGGGNDRIDGGAGDDTARFSGNRSDYEVLVAQDGTVSIADKRVAGGDGGDTISNVEFFQFADKTVSFANLQEPEPPSLSVSDDQQVDEDAGTVTLTVTRTGDLSQASSCWWTTATGGVNNPDGRADGYDITPVGGILNFLAGQSTATIIVPITNDTIDEPNEPFEVWIAGPTTNAVIGRSIATVTIIDDDEPTPADLTPPSAPSGLANAAITDGAVDAEGNIGSQALTGTAEAGATITVFDGDTVLGTTLAGSDGSWSFTLGVLADGAHSLSATATDAAGNTAYVLAAGAAVALPAFPGMMASADVDGDGHADVIVGRADGTLSVLLGDGNGDFGPAADTTIGLNITSIASGDVDGDGDLDLVVTRYAGSGNAKLLINDGNGGFTASDLSSGGTYPVEAVLADVNGDSKLDLLATHNDGFGGVSVALGLGNGSFAAATVVQAGQSPVGMDVGDVNGDGKLDIIAASYFDNTVHVLTGNGSGGFVQSQSFAVGQPQRIVLEDFNGDGFADMALSSAAGGVSVALGSASGLSAAVQYPTGLGSGQLTAADFNADGVLDLAVADASGAYVLFGNGSGSFGPATHLGGTGQTGGLISADLDGDGHSDLIVGDRSDGALEVYDGVPQHSGSLDFIVDGTAPEITSNGAGSSGTVSLAENLTSVTTVEADDTAGSALSFAIVGGADATLFAIDALTGALTFLSAPDFEVPDDADGDHVYDVVVRASDGINHDDQALAVTITNASPEVWRGEEGSRGFAGSSATPGNQATPGGDGGDGESVSLSILGAQSSFDLYEVYGGAGGAGGEGGSGGVLGSDIYPGADGGDGGNGGTADAYVSGVDFSGSGTLSLSVQVIGGSGGTGGLPGGGGPSADRGDGGLAGAASVSLTSTTITLTAAGSLQVMAGAMGGAGGTGLAAADGAGATTLISELTIAGSSAGDSIGVQAFAMGGNGGAAASYAGDPAILQGGDGSHAFAALTDSTFVTGGGSDALQLVLAGGGGAGGPVDWWDGPDGTSGTLHLTFNNNLIDLGSEDDQFIFQVNLNAYGGRNWDLDISGNVIDGGDGTDTLLINLPAGSQMDLKGNTITGFEYITITGAEMAVDGLSGSITYILTNGLDVFTGLANAEDIHAFGGDDVLDGGTGADVLRGGSGTDSLTGGSEADTFRGSLADLAGDTITDFTSEDRIVLDQSLAGIDQIELGTATNGDTEVRIDGDGDGLFETVLTLTGEVAGELVLGSIDGYANNVIQILANEENSPPTGLALDGASVDENVPGGTVVGTVSATDPDAGDQISYSLSDDAGGLFVLVGDQLMVADGAVLDFEQGSSYSVTVDATDLAGASVSETFTISVGDVNEEPDGLEVTLIEPLEENAAAGTTVALLSSSDPDDGDALTYSLSGESAELFVIVGDEVRVADGAVLDYEAAASHDLTVTVTDAAGLTRSFDITLALTNVNEAPSDLELSAAEIAEDAAGGTIVGTLETADPDGDSLFTYALADDANGLFEMVGNELRLAQGASLDFETAQSHEVTVEVTDADGLSYQEAFTISVTDVPEGPTDILVSGGTVTENSVPGTVVATLSAVDPDPNDTFTYALVDDPSGFFTITGNQVVVADGAAIDYETSTEHRVTLSVTDSSGLSYEEELVIGVVNVAPVIIGNNNANTLPGTSEEDQIFGRGGNDTLSGLEGDDQLFGEAGNDRLIGGIGADMLTGGLNNDTYVLATPEDVAQDVIVENAGEGTDTVEAAQSYTLSANLENLVLTGTSSIDGTGNALANSITGNAGSNKLDGGAGADTLTGGGGNDVYLVDDIGDRVVEANNGGDDEIRSQLASYSIAALGYVERLTYTGTANFTGTGNGLANTITGGSGSDTLDGGAGSDVLIGGGGNDSYIVNVATDQVVEVAGGGNADTVRSSVAYTLGAEVENLVLTGTSNITGTGNGLANTLTGNAGANTLNGGLGADTLIGAAGNDIYVIDNAGDIVTELAAQGTDTVQTALAQYTLTANVENLTFTGTGSFNGIGNELANSITGGAGADQLQGGGGVDVLTGNAGDDQLDGGAGGDTMRGGLDNDTYLIDSTSDVISESNNQGTDTVVSSVNYTLGSNLENLTLAGSAVSGTGNGLANTLTGSGLANTLNGAGGIDRLIGGGGNDTLTGGTGNDRFVYQGSGFGNDTITDFHASGKELDQIEFSTSLFANYAALQSHMTQVGANVVITLDAANSITLLGINMGNLDPSDFLFL